MAMRAVDHRHVETAKCIERLHARAQTDLDLSVLVELHAYAAAEAQMTVIGTEQHFGTPVFRIHPRIQYRETSTEDAAAVAGQQ
jgi:hypothetical protein